jgi:hypothetical protein
MVKAMGLFLLCFVLGFAVTSAALKVADSWLW